MIFDSYCVDPACPEFRRPVEHYYHRRDQEPNRCESCGGPTQKIEASRFAVVFTGVISAKYNDRDKEGSHLDGHWAFEKDAAGKPISTFIETWDQQRDYCKRNNLVNPKEMGRNFAVAEDGKTVLKPYGMPGTEI